MSRNQTKKKTSIFPLLLALIILLLVAGGGISLYRTIQNAILGNDGGNDGGWTDGTETIGAPFVVYQDENETPYSTEISNGVVIEETATFTVKHSVDDAEITVKATPIRLQNDYTFYCYNSKGQGYAYSWNKEIIGARQDEIDICQYFDIDIDQESNTIKVTGTTANALGGFAKSEFANGTYKLPVMPTQDMFCLAITTGGKTMKLNCSFKSKATGINLSQGQVYFGELV